MDKIEVTLETKITKITEDALQKAHQEIAKNVTSIIEINNQLTPLKDELINNTQMVHEIAEEQNDLKDSSH